MTTLALLSSTLFNKASLKRLSIAFIIVKMALNQPSRHCGELSRNCGQEEVAQFKHLGVHNSGMPQIGYINLYWEYYWLVKLID